MRLAALVAAAACHHDPAPAQPSSQRQLLERELDVVVKAAVALEHHITYDVKACKDVASAIRKFGADHAGKLDELHAMIAALSPEEHERFDEAHERDLAVLVSPLDAAQLSCGGDADVTAALEIAGFRY